MFSTKKSIVSLALAASLSLSLAAPARAAEPEQPLPEDAFSDLTPSGLFLGTTAHNAYLTGSKGRFRPDGSITRAETAQMLYRLLPQPVEAFAAYSDVPAGEWYYQAAGTLGALGVLRPGESTFLPDETITRGEFIRAAAQFFPQVSTAPQFTDVSPMDPNGSCYLTARSWGWLTGFKDGTLRPDQPITRAEAAVMLNRALGRSPDKEYLDAANPLLYLDVPADMWYYYDIMEASVSHEHTISYTGEEWLSHTAEPLKLEPGFHLIDNWLYYYSTELNNFVRNDSVGKFDFNAAGRFTTGSADLDARLHEIVKSKTDGSMTQEEKLRKLYVYTRDSFTYLRRPAYEFGATGFMQEDALNILTTGYGNCYSYASLFWYLSRWIGYDSKIYSGTVGSNRAPHSWVEIEFNGKNYIFDTELEMAYHKKGRYDINLYKYIDVDDWRYVKP